jgi:hypothetical protein
MNVNLPPIEVYVNNQYTQGVDGFESGILISARALKNQALQFSVLLYSGALYTGIPAQFITFKEVAPLPLNKCQPFDSIDDKIQCIELDSLRYMPCSVKTFDDEIIEGQYLFTIDFIGNGLSRHPIQWKQFHVIKSDHLLIYPQYRVRFLDKSLCGGQLPKYVYNDKIWTCE